jgi:hypothetical protein
MAIYSEKLIDKICEDIGNGLSIRKIAEKEGMPSFSTMMRWLSEEGKEYYQNQYARAREVQADYYVDQIMEKAEKCLPVTEEIQKARLEIDSIKWIAGKLKPKKYGDKMHLAGDDENPIGVQVFDFAVRELTPNDPTND